MIVTVRNLPEFAAGSQILATGDAELGTLSQQTGRIPGGLTLRAPRTEAWVGHLEANRAVSVEVRGQVHEFMVSQRRDNLEGPRAVFQCDPLHVVLRDAGIVDHLDDDGVSTINLGGPESGMSFRNYWFTYLAPFLARHNLGWIELGAVASNERLIYSWEAKTAQTVIVALVDQLGHEWRLRRDAANSRYLLDVGEDLGAEQLQSTVVEAINLVSLKRRLDRERLATVLRPISTLDNLAGDISLALWVVSAVAGDVVTLAPHAELGGAGPIAEPDQWAGLYLFAVAGTGYLIEASDAVNQTVTLEAGAGAHFSAADEVRFASSAAGGYVFEVRSPTGIAKHGRVATSIRLPFVGSALAAAVALIDWDTEPTLLRTSALNPGQHADRLEVRGGDINLPADAQVGDVFVIQSTNRDRYRSGRVTGVEAQPAFNPPAVKLLTDTDPRSSNANEVAVFRGGALPEGWSLANAGGHHLPVFRRTVRSLALANLMAVSSDRDGTLRELDAVPDGTRVEPGDLIDTTSFRRAWVIAATERQADGSLPLAVVDGNRGVGFPHNNNPLAYNIHRPTLTTVLSHVPVMLPPIALQNVEVDLPAVRLAPAEGASIYARIRFTSMCSVPLSSGWQRLPRLSLMQGNTVVGSAEATQIASGEFSTSGASVTREIMLGPIAISSGAEYHLRIRPGSSRGSSSTTHAPLIAMFLTEARLVVSTTGLTEGATLVPDAAVGVQLANKRLQRLRHWRAHYTCRLVELAEALELSPEAIRTQIGAKVRLSCPTLGVAGSFRIVGISFAPNSVETEVILESTRDRLTAAVARPGLPELNQIFFVQQNFEIVTDAEGNQVVQSTGSRVSAQPPSDSGSRPPEVPDDQLDRDEGVDIFPEGGRGRS